MPLLPGRENLFSWTSGKTRKAENNMFGNTFGRLFRITCSGESYAGGFRKNLPVPEELYGGLLTIVDGVPPGIKITAEMIQAELDKRKPGQTPLDSPRKEKDRVYIFSGVMENDLTTGAPVGMVIPNNDIQDVHIQQYREYRDQIRPGHAEYGFFKKYGEYGDWVGAGRASGRETASRVAGGAVAKAILDKMGIDVIAYTIESNGIRVKEPVSYETAKANYRKNEINCPDLELGEEMRKDVLRIKGMGETAGGVIECIARGVPAGLGEPVFDKLNAMIAHAVCSIGAIKGIEFGAGFEAARMLGSQSNDEAYLDADGRVRFKTNNAGGILGGISTWEEIRIRCAVKPTPTVSVPQATVDMVKQENTILSPITRRDPTLLPRIYPVIEAMMRCTILDAIYMAEAYWKVSGIDEKWKRM